METDFGPIDKYTFVPTDKNPVFSRSNIFS